jgi:hypothetical protein
MELKKQCVQKTVQYVCERCKYTTKDKTKYDSHLNRKFKCKPIEVSLSKLMTEMQQMHGKINKIGDKNVPSNNSYINNFTFINANFPNAYNIEDCLSYNNITSEIFEECGNKSVKDGAVYIMNTLCDDIQTRPIHCTDASRMSCIIKTNDSWIKDPKAIQIRSYFTPLLQTVYDEIYSRKMKNLSLSNEERIALLYKMSTDLLTHNIDKTSNVAVNTTVPKYFLKPIETPLITNDEHE